MIIEDGKGTGKKVRVSDDNRLNVSSRSNGRIYYVSRDDKKAFIVNLKLIQVSGGATENLGYIKNIGGGHIHIHSISLTTSEPATGLTRVGIWIKQTVSGGVEKDATNLNLSSAITSEAECYMAPGLTFSGGESMGTIRLSGSSTLERQYDDALILGYNNVLTIKANAETAGTEIVATITFWEHD